MGLEVATMTSIASGEESSKQVKVMIWQWRERRKKIKDPAETKEQQDMPTPPLFPQLLSQHHPLKKLQVTILTKGALELYPQNA